MMKNIPAIADIAPVLTSAADEIIIPLANQFCCTRKPDGSPVTDVDVAVQKKIQTELQHRWPDIGFLSEEMQQSEQEKTLHSDGLYWCLDPLDGTTNYVAGVPLYASSLALLSSQESLLGIVYDPLRKEMFSARLGEGAYLNGQRLSCTESKKALRECVAAVDFKRLPSSLRCRLAQSGPYRSQRNIGTVALEWCWMAADRFQLYLHGGQNLWDYAAGELIFRESGGVCRTLDGESIFANRLTPRSAIAAQNKLLFQLWRDSIEELSRAY